MNASGLSLKELDSAESLAVTTGAAVSASGIPFAELVNVDDCAG